MRCHIHKYVDAVDIKAPGRKRGTEQHQRGRVFRFPTALGLSSMQTVGLHTLEHQDRQERQEVHHNAATIRKGDRTVVSAFSKIKQKKPEATQASRICCI